MYPCCFSSIVISALYQHFAFVRLLFCGCLHPLSLSPILKRMTSNDIGWQFWLRVKLPFGIWLNWPGLNQALHGSKVAAEGARGVRQSAHKIEKGSYFPTASHLVDECAFTDYNMLKWCIRFLGLVPEPATFQTMLGCPCRLHDCSKSHSPHLSQLFTICHINGPWMAFISFRPGFHSQRPLPFLDEHLAEILLHLLPLMAGNESAISNCLISLISLINCFF